jgi:GR25 family glycosyltransferase involved in LPS biosynthesis
MLLLFILCVIIVYYHPPITQFGPQSTSLPSKHDVYVINLDSATKRLEHFKSEYTNSDMKTSVIRIAAINGRTINLHTIVSPRAYTEITQAEKSGFRQRHYELSRGAVGCYVSHLTAWQNLLQSDSSYCFIFEDDALIYPHIWDYISTYIKLPCDWDILLLGYECIQCQKDVRLHVHKVKKFFGLHGYIINKNAVRKIMKNPRIKPIRKQIDTVLSDMCRANELKIYASRKKLVEQNNIDFGTQIQLPLKFEDGKNVWTSYDELQEKQ